MCNVTLIMASISDLDFLIFKILGDFNKFNLYKN